VYTDAFNDGEFFDEHGIGWWPGEVHSMESEYG